jgi:hypothetical protein
MRLSEALQSAVISQLIHERGDAEVDGTLNAAIQRRGGFWYATLLAHQTTLFICISALLDNSKNVASFYSILAAIEAEIPDEIPEEFRDTLRPSLDAIGNRYNRLRHKLFGHTDLERKKFMAQFDAAGFTHLSIANDLEELEYVFKVLFAIGSGHEHVPQRGEILHYPYSMHVAAVQRDTDALLNDLVATFVSR